MVGILVVAGAAGVGLVVLGDDDDDGEDAAFPLTTTTTVADTTVPPGSDTTTTTAAAATTTTTARSTTSTTRASTTTSTTTAGSSTTVAASPSACGTGQASVAFAAKDLVTDAISSAFTPQATVANQVSQPIEVEEIVLEVIYPGNDVRTVKFSTSGTVIAPSTSASFTAERLTTARRYDSVRFTRFSYFTEVRQATCRVTTP